MGGCAFRERRVLQELFPVHLIVVDFIYLEHTLRQRSGLVKYHISCLGQRLQIVGTFDQHSCIASSSDPGKKA